MIRSLGLLLAAVLAAGPAAAAKLNAPAEPYTVTTFRQEKVNSTDLRGKVVVLNYWATWCAPCRAEMLAMDDYVRKHPDSDLRIYAITTESHAPQWIMQKLSDVLAFPLAVRLSGRGYGPIHNSFPSSYVIDRNGVVRDIELGAFDEESFEATVKPLLAEPVAAQP